jgi:hypothetical protein
MDDYGRCITFKNSGNRDVTVEGFYRNEQSRYRQFCCSNEERACGSGGLQGSAPQLESPHQSRGTTLIMFGDLFTAAWWNGSS